ncbi:MAG: M13 family metallopeptidase [Parabacteroides sp.]|nr:M13 family metallopeptidase [Parabacteroides sp.]
MNKMIAFTLIAGSLAAAGCSMPGRQAAPTGVVLANLDTAVAPSADFYRYACGGWMKNNPLKPEYARYGMMDKLAENNQHQLKELFEELSAASQAAGSVGEKIASFYAQGLDSVKLNADGAAPVKAGLAEIEAITDRASLAKQIARLHREGISPYFYLFVSADEKNSSMNIVQLYQGGLAMGDRDYYLQPGADMDQIRQAYRNYITDLFTLAGYTPRQAEAATDAVLKIETGIAGISIPKEALRDPQKNYNKMALDEFASAGNFFDWKVYFETLGLDGQKEIDPKQITFYRDLDKLMKGVTLPEQKYYLAYNLLNDAAPYLSDDFVNASFEFYGKMMSGKQEQKPRWKRALGTVDNALAEAVGQMYVAKYFPPSSKEKMLDLVGNLQQALGERIAGLEWMGDTTKAKAQEKLAAFTVKIGYPDTWRDYSALEIKPDSYWNNVRRARIFETEYQLADAGKPVDKSRWLMSPQTVNAYYNPTTNEICFPAAILQPPFFDPAADDALNYGAIGVVIGHEMTHGFDDQGRNYDKEGNLTDWWTPEDAARFKERADVLAAQYNAIIVADTVHANGEYTLGENIADHGGLLVAHAAYNKSLEGKTPAAVNDGFTPEQRFFLGYATLWAQNIRTEEILRLTKLDVHSLAEWRVNAALRNIEPFYTAFNITPADSMYMAPEERVVIW